MGVSWVDERLESMLGAVECLFMALDVELKIMDDRFMPCNEM